MLKKFLERISKPFLSLLSLSYRPELLELEQLELLSHSADAHNRLLRQLEEENRRVSLQSASHFLLFLILLFPFAFLPSPPLALLPSTITYSLLRDEIAQKQKIGIWQMHQSQN